MAPDPRSARLSLLADYYVSTVRLFHNLLQITIEETPRFPLAFVIPSTYKYEWQFERAPWPDDQPQIHKW